MNDKKIRILSVGDNPLVSTGYGQVYNNLLTRWCKAKPDWEFYHIGWQNQDRMHQRKEGYFMLPMGRIEHGYDAVAENLIKLQPEIFISLSDVGYQSGYVQVVNDARQAGWRGKWLAYTPLDSHGWAWTWDEIFQHPDINIAMAKFGEAQMKKHNVPNVTCIPHGVDLEVYKPVDKDTRATLKAKYNLSDKFVVGYVGRNQKRKMLDRLLMSFAIFAKDKPDVVLLLHTDEEPVRDGMGWSLPYMLNLFGIKDKVKLTKSKLDVQVRQKIQPENMNEIYNMMDVFAYYTGGEGFGLPGIECQASGVPLIMTDCTTAYDFCKPENRIAKLKDKHNRDSIDIGANGIYFMYPDDIHGAALLNKFYHLSKLNPVEYAKEGIEARKIATQYSWEDMANAWIRLFEEQLE